MIGELRDWIEYEGRRYFPSLIKYVQIVLVEAGNCVLAVFDQELQKEALNRLTSRTTKLLDAGLIDKEITRVNTAAFTLFCFLVVNTYSSVRISECIY